MKKQLLSILILSMMISSPLVAFADEYYTSQYAPAEQANEYQTQYPLPVNNYKTQGYTPAQQNPNANNYTTADNLRGNVIMVPANTTFNANLMSPLSSEYTKVGDNVSMYLDNDFYYGTKLIAASGSRLNGTVIKARKGGYAGKNGNIQIRFTNLITPTGQVIPLSAHVETDDGSGILKAGTARDVVGDYAKNVGIGAASGAALGTAMGALSHGQVGKGAIYGTAIGGTMGIISAVMNRGDNVDIPQNAQLKIVLDQPITISSNSSF